MTGQTFGPEWIEIDPEDAREGDRITWNADLHGFAAHEVYLNYKGQRYLAGKGPLSLVLGLSDISEVKGWRRLPQLPTEEGAAFRAKLTEAIDPERLSMLFEAMPRAGSGVRYYAAGVRDPYDVDDIDASTVVLLREVDQ